MFARLVLAAFGPLEVVMPRRLVDLWMRLAAKNGDEVEVRPWVYSAARVEGMVVLLWAVTRGSNDGS